VDSKENVYVADFGNQAFKEVMTKSVALSGTAVGQGSTSPSLTFTFDTGGQIAAPGVLTEGVTGLDLSDAGTGSCTTNGPSYTYTPGDTCTVQLNFSPRVAGLRRGAVELTTTAGAVIATAYVYGTGIGPQVVFNPGVLSTLGGGFSYPDGVAVDGSGNVYVADSSNKAITEMPAGCMSASCLTKLGGGFSNPRAIALDGGGNIYFADANVVKEMPPGCMSASCVTTVSGNFGNPQSLAVDGSGNLYFCQTAFNVVNEIPAGCASLSCATVLGGGFEQPTAVAVDGSGNVYVGDGVNSALYRIPPGCTSSSCVTTLNGAIVIDTIAVDGSGDVYLTSGGTVYEIPAGCPSASCMTPLASVPEYSWIAVDGDGNIYVSSGFTKLVQKMDRVDPPTLTFAPTAVGSTNSSPQTVTLANIGNAPLTFPAPASGQDPSVSSSNFLFGNSSTCPILSSSSNPGTLASGSNCTFMMDFAPAAPGSLNGSLLVTDSNLNATSATQSIPLSGTGIQITLNPPAGSLPNATSGQLYNQVFLAGGGTAPYTCTSTALALGLTLSSTGVLSGTPTSTGSYAFSVTATDSSEFTVTQNYTLTVNGSFKLIATPSSETVPRGILAAFLLEVESLNGFSGSIAITCAGGPSSSVCGSFPETLKLQPNKVAIALSGVLFPKNTPPG
jgi:streptogramin lyase